MEGPCPASLNFSEAGSFLEKLLIPVNPCSSPLPPSSGVISVPEVSSRMWRLCFFYFGGVKCLQVKKSKRRGVGKNPTHPQSPTMQKERSDIAASASTSFPAVNEFFASGRESEEAAADLSLQRAAHPLQKGDPAGSDLRSGFNPPQARP